jgi:hypothetical protein
MDSFDLLPLANLQFQGQVFKRILYYMLVTFDVFQVLESYWYQQVIILTFQFMFRLIIDVLVKLIN